MFARKKRQVPQLNTTSTADISFMLLVFFLVTSSMDASRALCHQLPPPEDEEQEQLVAVKERNVLEIDIAPDGTYSVAGEPIGASELKTRIADFVLNPTGDPSLPEQTELEVPLLGLQPVSNRHIIYINASEASSYEAYFRLQDAIAAAYSEQRNSLAMRYFGKPLTDCNAEQRRAVATILPQRVSEVIG